MDFYTRMYDVRRPSVCIPRALCVDRYSLRSLIADGSLLAVATMVICSRCENLLFAAIASHQSIHGVNQVLCVDESATRIKETLLSLPEDVVPIVAAHNGPTGLGRDAWSICGVDFKPGAGGLLVVHALVLAEPM